MATDLNIGLTFSGGGYRAATFDLGVLSFLNYIKLDDGRTLLDCVRVLTSVSGGSIPALKYMLTRAQGKSVDDMVKELFDFLCNDDLMGMAFQRLSDEKANREASSIKIMAEIYDNYLFGNATMGDIIDNFDKVPVKDYTALATDFDNALPFRFRLTEAQMLDGGKESYGVFGNGKNVISRSVVKYITLGEAMACSSCFPSGFEPMMFPDDFRVSQNPEIAPGIKHRFGIMDGGVVDNQGIDPLLLADDRMRKYRKDDNAGDDTRPALDLIIVSDVSSPTMNDGFRPMEQLMPNSIGKLTIGRLCTYGLVGEAIVMLLFVIALLVGNSFWLGVLTVILVIVTLLNAAGALLKCKMFGAIRKTFVGDRAAFISHMKFATIEALLMNRAKSVIMMSSEVFLKRLRQMNYKSIFEDPIYRSRAVSSTIYELGNNKKQTWMSNVKNGIIPEELAPSEAMQETTNKAAGMGTTLWFTEAEKRDKMPHNLLAAGQYTVCFNLLVQIHRLQQTPDALTPADNLLIVCKPQLLAAWERFKQDPHWMVPQSSRP